MPTITRRAPLAKIPRPTCPAALPIAGTTSTGCGIVCRVIELDRQREPGDGLTPTQLASVRDGSGVFMTAKSDPNVISRLCCGDGVPVVDRRGHYARDSYTFCPVWQAEKQRIDDGRQLLAGSGLTNGDDADPVESYDPDYKPVGG